MEMRPRPPGQAGAGRARIQVLAQAMGPAPMTQTYMRWRPSQTAQSMRVSMAASRPRSSYDLGQNLGVHAIFIDAYVPNRVMVDHLPSPMLYTLVHVVAPSQESSR